MIRSVIMSAMFIALIVGGCQQPAGESLRRAGVGDTMWVILNHVKPDKIQQFERFVEEILNPAEEEVAKTDSIVMAAMNQERTLYPTGPNDDSTYTYVWLMDPLVSGASYTFSGLFGQLYSEEETEEYIKIFTDALDRPQEAYVVIQQ